jgi:hypothetical protein
VVSRDELNASQLAELAALDRILAREPVDEEHLELAALVDSVRAGAPRMGSAFSAQLDAKLAQLGDRRWRVARPSLRRLATARPGWRGLAAASGGLVAAAVALTIVISGGLLDGASNPPARSTPRGQGQAFEPAIKHAASQSSRPAPTVAAGVAGPTGATTAFGVVVTGPGGAAVASNSGAATGTTSGPRLVHRNSTLTLASAPATMQAVANQIVSAAEQQGGVVANSDVNIQGQSSYASFSLQVPSGHLAPLIATLSSLASVRALTQSTNDITDGYNAETARLADSVAERAALLKKLATAATTADATSYQQQIDALGHRIAAEHRAIDGLLNQGHTATLQVNVVPGPSTKKHTVVAGPLSSAFHTALHALQEILAIALIVLAIVLPFALTALALWWSAASLRQRARERAMKAA